MGPQSKMLKLFPGDQCRSPYERRAGMRSNACLKRNGRRMTLLEQRSQSGR